MQAFAREMPGSNPQGKVFKITRAAALKPSSIKAFTLKAMNFSL
jgi:hypothetical protein